MRRKQISQTQHELLGGEGDNILICTLRRYRDEWAVEWEPDWYTASQLENVIEELRRLNNAGETE